MKENVFDVLMYLFENYMDEGTEFQPDQEALTHELTQAGFRRGEIRILLPINGTQVRHLSTFGQGNFFGEMAFLDGAPRSADAIAFTDTDLYVLPRKTFDKIAEEHKKIAIKLLESLASTLSARLRYANAEMRALEA